MDDLKGVMSTTPTHPRASLAYRPAQGTHATVDAR